MLTTQDILERAVKAKPVLFTMDTKTKNECLECMAQSLIDDIDIILEANKVDVEKAKDDISSVMLDRLVLTVRRIEDMAEGIRNVAKLPDPVGRVIEERATADGLDLKKVSVPIGVIAIIYESRPNVTSDAAALCIKSGNVCILRCGKEAHDSASKIVESMKKGIEKAGVDPDIVNLVEDTSRESATTLMRARGYVDLLIPRGGAGLISSCVENSIVPVIETGTGICTVYVDKSADFEMAVRIVENAKTQRPSVCNAQETLLVHKDVSERFLPMIRQALVDKRISNSQIPVELRGCERTLKIIEALPAKDSDYDTEFLDYILAIKVVDSVEEAIKHIEKRSTHHSESIITKDDLSALKFTSSIDSACVYVNASTRFTDGGMFGLGCEMGISTQKLHARGPMGLSELNTYKYVITGNGQIRG